MNCRLCNSSNLFLLYTQGNQDEFRFYRCRRCQLVNYDLSGGLDQAKYAREYVDPFDPAPKLNLAQTLSFDSFRSFLPQPGRMLEIGCGNGRLLLLAREAGWSVRGLELSSFLAESLHARLGIDVEVADFLHYQPAQPEPYDAVILRHVLEHLPDSRGAMTCLHALLREGGHVMLEFPNIDGLDLRFKRFLRRRGVHRKRYPPDYRPGHCNEFNHASFCYLLRETGFSLISWQTYSYRWISNRVFTTWPIGNKARVILRKVACSA